MFNATHSHRGIKKGLDIKGSSQEVNIVYKFSEVFFVTFSRESRFKNSEYNFVFLKPDSIFKEKFNLSNEVLLLFSNYEEFDTRTMDFVDKTLQEFDNRLDKVCILLVSKDPKIELKIEKLNNDNKDSKIVVPFTYKEFEGTGLSVNSIENRFRKYFYNRDLFALESPLKNDAYFFGRNKVVQNFYDKYSLGEHSGLFGLRKIGKTSVLFSLERLIKLRNGISIYLDCQNTSINKSEWYELLFIIINSLKEKYNLDLEINRSEYNSRFASESFEKDLKSIYHLLGERRILIILDEIEHISFSTSVSDHWASGKSYLDFWQTIRAIYHKNEDLFSFIIAGVNPLCVEEPLVNGFDNPIFSMIKPTYLNLFTVDNVKQMVGNIGHYMGLHFEEEIYTYLTEDYGGHPFLIRQVCSLINESVTHRRPTTITKYMYKRDKKEYDLKIHEYIQLILSILNRWYPQEYKLLEELVINGNNEFRTRFGDYEKIIKHLKGYGILKEDNGEYFITIDAIKKYIQSNVKRRENLSTKEGMWKEVSVRRNTIEEKLRKIILISLSSKYGPKRARELIIQHTRNKDKIDGLKIQEIISEKMYFRELKDLILKEWTVFNNIFHEKEKFMIFVDFINKMRIDAHAKDIDESDLAILLISFKWLEEKIDDVLI
ncbi:hypothetical protein BHF71_09975 [Vulcanibacillus modesticaldus]|uniref:ATP-binding protein n=1 Tax=Vulcanibacillus modesticaldus TaxID=337097 RepID=A0A1D2YTX1_9BACI|nr:hypothetical protein [Vulcanibacillus modesticaldus]OEF99152.1 hypothetical protein BHF71_09975 [Vulcanibacillus modesticaldus]